MKHRHAPRPLATAIGSLTDQLAPQTLLADVQRVWPEVAGELVAAEAQPTSERDGTVVLSCRTGVWAQELDLMGPELVGRLNTALQTDRVRVLRCRVRTPD